MPKIIAFFLAFFLFLSMGEASRLRSDEASPDYRGPLPLNVHCFERNANECLLLHWDSLMGSVRLAAFAQVNKECAPYLCSYLHFRQQFLIETRGFGLDLRSYDAVFYNPYKDLMKVGCSTHPPLSVFFRIGRDLETILDVDEFDDWHVIKPDADSENVAVGIALAQGEYIHCKVMLPISLWEK